MQVQVVVATSTPADPYALEADFERAVVALAATRRRFWGRVGHALDPDLLGDANARLACRAIAAIAKDLGHGPDSALLVVQRLRRWRDEGRVTAEEIAAVDEYIQDAEDHGLPDEEAVVSELAPILRRRAENAAVVRAIDLYGKRADLSEVTDLLGQAERIGAADLAIGTKADDGLFAEVQKLQHAERLPTGIPELDVQLDGGLQRGGLGIALGGTGSGKSMYLTQVAAHAALLGYAVAVATLELPEPLWLARYAANITGVPIHAILDGSMDEARRRLARMSGHMGPCVVKEFTPHGTTNADIEQWIEVCEADLGRPIDLLVVDYVGKMISGKKDENTYTAMRVICEGLRLWADENNKWVWSAEQTQRRKREGRSKKQRTDTDDVAGSMHTARVADLVITLAAVGGSDTDDGSEPDHSQLEYFIAKHRTGRSRIAIGPLPTSFEVAQIAPVARGAGILTDA
jgi:hypothetical protein